MTDRFFALNDSNRMARSQSLQSDGDQNESQNLLASPAVAPRERDHEETDQQNSAIGRALKRHLEPLMMEMKLLKRQNVALDKKVTSVLQKNENLEKMMKEMAAKNVKNPETLDTLLSMDGVKQLRSMVYKNLDMKAKDKEETALLDSFFTFAKEEGWLVKTLGRSKKDIITKYRKYRNYLKSQIRLRVVQDLTNKTPEQMTELQQTTSFIMESLDVTELTEDHLRILYNFAFTLLKYTNKKVNADSFSPAEMRNQGEAKTNPWKYVMGRVQGDRSAGRDYEYIKERFVVLADSGLSFEPL